MHILMFGWEFPPIQSGGLGVACQGIVEGLISDKHKVHLVLPRVSAAMRMYDPELFNLLSAKESGGMIEGLVGVHRVDTGLYSPYASSQEEYVKWLEEKRRQNEGDGVGGPIYGRNIMEEVHRYAAQAAVHAKKVHHDVIHTHDWLTAEAGIQAKKLSGKPHVMQVHATEFDRSGDTPNQQVYDLERRGMENADRVIAVSHYTKKMLMKHYGIPDWKIDVVHNAVKPDFTTYHKTHHLDRKDQIVLFLGRMTMQKGPDYFLQMAAKVLHILPHTKFVMAGDGDMMQQVINQALGLGIERNVLFSGFLKGAEIKRAYSEADLYVMPSVSEPFGLTPLEAIRQGTPVLISKQAGVNEVIKNSLKVDFWDVDEMANKVVATLQHPALMNTLRQHSTRELDHISWDKQAKHIASSYQKAVS